VLRKTENNASATICNSACVRWEKETHVFFLLYHVFKLGWMNLELLYVLELIRSSGEILV